jgi:DNA repair exonuclease SbcCD ATPase subunit
MIILKTMVWSNAFSYGENNYIDFSSAPLLQLLGRNGHGKTSIALILEEVLFNKNSKGIKKSDVLNRHLQVKKYSISLTFSSNQDEYHIHTVRGTTQSVSLSKNGEDISEHTATATYKLIEEILGFDHKTFSQIVYQSSAYSLEFLTATDSNRKKFLIDLLNLSKYTDTLDTCKAKSKELGLQVDTLDAKLSTVSSWLAKFGSVSLVKKELVEVPATVPEWTRELEEAKVELLNIDATNKKITKNNEYMAIYSKLVYVDVKKPFDNTNNLAVSISLLKADKAKAEKVISGTGPISTKCGFCGQAVDNSHKLVMVEEAKVRVAIINPQLTDLEMQLATNKAELAEYNKAEAVKLEIEKYHALIDTRIPTQLLSKTDLEAKIVLLRLSISARDKEIATANALNIEATTHNTKIDVIIQQMATMKLDHLTYSQEKDVVSARFNRFQVLLKAFSTTGLVAYKIECLVKDLEELTNQYLLDMSDGRFQLYFRVNSSDKLNVVIVDNGVEIDILALSNGERARVNISTLLAIRTLMQSLSNCRINLLILDETVESLDVDGKEKLVEVLLKEDHLNTILVSHGFSHPLLEKLSVVKENNISRIE